MDADKLIRKAFEDAELATPEQELKARMIRESIEPMLDDDHRQYEYLSKTIDPSNRGRLALDFEVWLALNEIASSLLAKAQLELLNSPGVEPGPLLAKLQRPIMRPPRKWRPCFQCGGKGDDCWVSKCNGCGGAGYNV